MSHGQPEKYKHDVLISSRSVASVFRIRAKHLSLLSSDRCTSAQSTANSHLSCLHVFGTGWKKWKGILPRLTQPKCSTRNNNHLNIRGGASVDENGNFYSNQIGSVDKVGSRDGFEIRRVSSDQFTGEGLSSDQEDMQSRELDDFSLAPLSTMGNLVAVTQLCETEDDTIDECTLLDTQDATCPTSKVQELIQHYLAVERKKQKQAEIEKEQELKEEQERIERLKQRELERQRQLQNGSLSSSTIKMTSQQDLQQEGRFDNLLVTSDDDTVDEEHRRRVRSSRTTAGLVISAMIGMCSLCSVEAFVGHTAARQRLRPGFINAATVSDGACQSDKQRYSSPSSSFWNNEDLVYKTITEDPPPQDVLKQIQEQPWRGGLEPVQPISGGIPRHEARVIQGEIPKDLSGVLCRNGSGRIRVGSKRYGHWFDGDGIVTKLTVDGLNQQATYEAKYVQTKRFTAQQELQRKSGSSQQEDQIYLPYPGAWTKRGTGNWWENMFRIPINPSNTNCLIVPNKEVSGDDGRSPLSSKLKLYALAEGGLPIEMDADTLDTRFDGKGVSNIGAKNSDATIGSCFSAHYVQDPISGDIFNHGLVLGPIPTLNVMRFDRFGTLRNQKTTKLPFSTMIHDLTQTENHLVIVVNPYISPPMAILDVYLGRTSIGETYAWNPNNEQTQTLVMVFSKDTLECVGRIALPLFSTYHMIDAYESGTSSTILTLRTLIHDGPIETIRRDVEQSFKDMYSASNIPNCRIMEYTMELSSERLLSERPLASGIAAPCEFPEINASWASFRHRYTYTNVREPSSDFLNGLQKVDLDGDDGSGNDRSSKVVSFGEGVYAGAPVFVSKPQPTSEDDGYILSQLYRSNEHNTDICILDARTMETLTLLRLDSSIPYQFHGAWWPLS